MALNDALKLRQLVRVGNAGRGPSATVAKALAGSDAWAPQTVNAGQPNAGRLYAAGFTADYVVTKDGTGSHTTIQSALNAASTSTAARVRRT